MDSRSGQGNASSDSTGYEYFGAGPASDGQSASESNDGAEKRKFPKRWIALAIALVLVVVVAVAGVSVVRSNGEIADEYAEERQSLVERVGRAYSVLDASGDLHEATADDLAREIEAAESLLASDPPTMFSVSASSDLDAINSRYRSLGKPLRELIAGEERRSEYETAVQASKDVHVGASDTAKELSKKVLDSKLLSNLKADIEELQATLEDEWPAGQLGWFNGATSRITEASDAVLASEELVKDDHERWLEAEEEKAAEAERKALKDPKNYKQISDRDWSLVERSPDSYSDDKYVVYGRVTQADAATGSFAIRVNTSGTRQSREYSYDVNTMVSAGELGMFDNVVSGDIVKLLVEVDGSMSYETTMGATISALQVTAYVVDVIG